MSEAYLEAQREAELLASYSSLPRLECQKLCHGSCGPIVMSALERDRLISTHGDRTCEDDLVCPYLERDSGLCGAYEARPLNLPSLGRHRVAALPLRLRAGVGSHGAPDGPRGGGPDRVGAGALLGSGAHGLDRLAALPRGY